MKKKDSYDYKELIDCGKGLIFGEGNAKLPLPPMSVSYTHLRAHET